MSTSGRAAHWDEAYRSRGVESASWYEAEPTTSLELVGALGVDPAVPVVDVGGGAAGLADRLVGRGFQDVTVLDVSGAALEEARRRVGADAPVRWVHEDVLDWRPTRRYGLWHDRAVFHFLVEEADRTRYLASLAGAIADGGAVIVATFADDGPERCSGLRVARYDADELVHVLGPGFVAVETARVLHTTPSGAVQPFVWVAGRFAADES